MSSKDVDSVVSTLVVSQLLQENFKCEEYFLNIIVYGVPETSSASYNSVDF